ncbi:hypothetical protein [Pandoraea pulmonicola]|uniref:Uncharacterized protein n=2 Tax=Pandoraea pulmonicola TaxID=93221 RepID=A0AAJ4ZGP2_PANPU|nr:hypothetical protein [Pandoraea pulmonicola]SUA92995.1 Uncharacterised protein [Pandoraea pulmonicola]
MKLSAKLVFGFLVGVSSCVSQAQTADRCNQVLQTSARNYEMSTSYDAVSYSVYDQYCEGDQVRSGTSFSASLDAVIKAVPIKFNLGQGSTEERVRNFCKTFDSAYKSDKSRYQESSTVVGTTTRAWLQCMALASRGVDFAPDISREHVNIDVRRTNASEVSVQGVVYNNEVMNCTVPVSDQSTTRATATEQTTMRLSEKDWVITCVRKPRTEKTETVYPSGDITVVTTAGQFTLPVAAEARFPREWSGEFQTSLDKLSEDQQLTKARLTVMEARSSATPKGAWQPDQGFGGGLNKVAHESACPAGQVMVGLQIVTGGTCHGFCDPDGRPVTSFKIQCAQKY